MKTGVGWSISVFSSVNYAKKAGVIKSVTFVFGRRSCRPTECGLPSCQCNEQKAKLRLKQDLIEMVEAFRVVKRHSLTHKSVWVSTEDRRRV